MTHTCRLAGAVFGPTSLALRSLASPRTESEMCILFTSLRAQARTLRNAKHNAKHIPLSAVTRDTGGVSPHDCLVCMCTFSNAPPLLYLSCFTHFSGHACSCALGPSRIGGEDMHRAIMGCSCQPGEKHQQGGSELSSLERNGAPLRLLTPRLFCSQHKICKWRRRVGAAISSSPVPQSRRQPHNNGTMTTHYAHATRPDRPSGEKVVNAPTAPP